MQKENKPNIFSSLFGFKKPSQKTKDSHQDKIKKLNPGQFLNQEIDYKPLGTKSEDSIENNEYFMENFKRMFSQPIVDLKELRSFCSSGVPKQYRARCWKLLSGYLPINLAKIDEELDLKRKEYARLRTQFYEENFDKVNNKRLQEGLSTIMKDVSRTLGDTAMFKSRPVRDMLTRILYIFHVRNSESGYAQGMNDIVAPFLIVFATEYLSVDEDTLQVDATFEHQMSEQIILNIEADTYWCYTRLIANIKNNYTPSFPGVMEMIKKLNVLIQKIDPELDKVLRVNKVKYYNIVFQWFLCLLLRQFAPRLKFRLIDFYFTEKETINESMVYLSAAFLMKFSNKIKELNAYDKILMHFTMLKTDDWGEVDLSMLLGESHLYKNSYNYAELNIENIMSDDVDFD